MFKAIYRIFSNLWYVLSGTQKADNKLEKEFISIWEKRIEQRMSPEFDWDTMTHPDDIPTYGDAKRNADPCNGGGTLDKVWKARTLCDIIEVAEDDMKSNGEELEEII